MIRMAVAAAVSLMITTAWADDCTDAIARVHDAQDQERHWFAAEVKTVLGADATDFDFNYFVECQKMLPIARKRLTLVEGIIAKNDRAARVCKSDDGSTKFGGYPATEMRAILKEYIAICGVEEE